MRPGEPWRSIRSPSRRTPGALSSRVASLLTLTELLAGGLAPNQRAAAEALSFAYASKGFTDEGRGTGGTPPSLADLQAALDPSTRPVDGAGTKRSGGVGAAARAVRRGSGFMALRAGLGRPAPDNSPAQAYVLSGLPEEDRAPAMFLVLDRIWSELAGNTERTLIAVDEAWWLMQYPDTARFLQRLAKTARKRHAGLTLISQDVGDVLDNPIGEAVVTNAAVQILMKQASQAMPRLSELFQLTRAEQSWLLNAQQGEGLLMAMGKRVPFKVVASAEETAIIEADSQREREAA